MEDDNSDQIVTDVTHFRKYDPHKMYPYVDVPLSPKIKKKKWGLPSKKHCEIQLLDKVESLQVNVRDLLASQRFHHDLLTKLGDSQSPDSPQVEHNSPQPPILSPADLGIVSNL